MKLLKITLLSLILGIILSLVSCETIYNYDLQFDGLDSLPATRSCIMKYIPNSIDAHEGRQTQVIEQLGIDLNDYEQEIRDSLLSDSVNIDTIVTLNFTIIAQDPNYDITVVDFSKTYYPNNE